MNFKIFLASIFLLSFAPNVFAGANTEYEIAYEPTSSNLYQNIQDEVDQRIDVLVASTSNRALWLTRGTNVNPWVWNPDVWTNEGTSSIDWTGVTPWNSHKSYQKGGVLVTPRHIIFANHYLISVGATVVFIEPDGTIVTRTIASSTNAAGDVQVGLLNSPVPSSIKHYPILSESDWRQYDLDSSTANTNNIPTVYFTQNDIVGINNTSKNYLASSTDLIYDVSPSGDRADFEEPIINGDSGNPSFAIIAGEPVLIAIRYLTNAGTSMSYYRDEIETAIDALSGSDEYDLSTLDITDFTSADEALLFIGPEFDEDEYNFEIDEGSSNATVVGSVSATDNEDVTYSIQSGNSLNSFSISSTSGQIVVVDSVNLDFDINPTFTLVIRATDESVNNNFNDVTVHISLQERSNSSSGGGGGVSTPKKKTIKPVVLQPIIPKPTNILAPTPIPVITHPIVPTYTFTRPLSLGSTGPDVLVLQKFLNITGFSVASVGVGSVGFETQYFGPATKSALARFQAAMGISPASGDFGSSTQAYVKFSTTLATSTVSTAVAVTDIPKNSTVSSFTRPLTIGSVGEDVRKLQKFLNAKNFSISSSGVGSIGNETDYFGPATKAALARFQAANGIVPASGYFGPITISKISTSF